RERGSGERSTVRRERDERSLAVYSDVLGALPGRRQLPEVDRRPVRHGDTSAVRRERRVDHAVVWGEIPRGGEPVLHPAAGDVPDLHRAAAHALRFMRGAWPRVPAPGGEQPAVRRQGAAYKPVLEGSDRAEVLAGRRLPDVNGALLVTAAGEEPA